MTWIRLQNTPASSNFQSTKQAVQLAARPSLNSLVTPCKCTVATTNHQIGCFAALSFASCAGIRKRIYIMLTAMLQLLREDTH
jgi:hypothetical protein